MPWRFIGGLMSRHELEIEAFIVSDKQEKPDDYIGAVGKRYNKIYIKHSRYKDE